jgi:homoserine dehydrogenase
MKRISLVQVGFGTVGGAVIGQVLDQRERWRTSLGIDVRFVAVAGSRGAAVAEGDDGLEEPWLQALVHGRQTGEAGLNGEVSLVDALPSIAGSGPTIVFDAAAGEATADIDEAALKSGAGVVLSNKAPLALPLADPRSQVMWSHTGSRGRLMYEATCGAGLPVISTLQSLIDTGDEILEISGTVSGTLGAIFSSVATGTPFSTAVRDALAQGYTEPDPRDDLSGLDVARKGLILARTMGQEMDLDDIDVTSLVPKELAGVSVDEFLERIESEDHSIRLKSSDAISADGTLKYLLRWIPDGGVSVGLGTVPRETVLGALQGPENIVSFRTRRYDQYPCVISGPGAGAEVTAAGMVSDMLHLAQRL